MHSNEQFGNYVDDVVSNYQEWDGCRGPLIRDEFYLVIGCNFQDSSCFNCSSCQSIYSIYYIVKGGPMVPCHAP